MEMRPGPATPTAFARGFLRCLITAWRRNDRFGPTALPLSRATSAAFAKASCPFAISRSRIRTCCGTPAALPAPKNRWGNEAATPGLPVAPCAFLEGFPRQFAFENYRLPLALPQSSGKIRNDHVSLNPLLSSLVRRATENSAAIVRNLWTMKLPCGRRRKTK